MTPGELLSAARDLVEQPRERTGGLWCRSATLLARQALEGALDDVLRTRAPGSQAASFSARLLVLGEVLGDRELARESSYVWAALSAASHQHGYALPPTVGELRRWIAVVERLVGMG